MNPNVCSDFLVPTSSFLIGMGSCINLSGQLYSYNVSATPAEADGRALRSDWEMVGKDILAVMAKKSPREVAAIV